MSEEKKNSEKNIDILEGQPCPVCHKDTLTLRELERDIPHFGKCYIFSMECSNCDYNMSDVEAEKNENNPVKYTLDVETEEDLNIRIIKSSQATIKISRMTEITPGPVSNGYITNVEGVIRRFQDILQALKDDEDKAVRTKVKNQLKKLQKVLWGRDKLTLIIEDESGNSAILSDKAKKS